MKPSVNRRSFLAGLLGGASTVLILPIVSAETHPTPADQGLCVTLCSHWSYIGIGWQLGIESCVLSVTDAMEMADREPHVKTCINMDARAYEFMAEKFPEVAERLNKHLAAGKVELIGGTYAQPMGTTISGESNIRQIVYGRETIREALGYEMVTFLEEEEFSHPQIPQIALGAGYRYASLAQVDTWGNAGIPRLELNAFRWKGKDGTTVPCIPKNSLFGYSPDLKQLASSEAFKKLRALGKPLIFTWEEFGWEPPEEPAYLKTPEKYKKLAEESPVEFVTLKEYLDKYGAQGTDELYLNMDAWNKLLTWGLGGDQLRIMDRKVEGLLLAAERFDAIASSLGARTNEPRLEKAWKDLLTAQSHDVSLCEYSRWQGDRMAPLDRIEDKHNFTWGAIGYNHLDAAESQGRAVLEASTAYIAERIGSARQNEGQLTATVFNPSAWTRTDIASTGRVYPIPTETKDIVVKDRSGRAVPSQIIKSSRDGLGNLLVAEVAFLATDVPGIGYDTYYLELLPESPKPQATSLRVDEGHLELENEFVKIRLGATHGAIVSLIDKKTGQEVLGGQKGPSPILMGSPNQDYCLASPTIREKYHQSGLVVPSAIDSSKSSSPVIQCTEKGPLRATVKADHQWPMLKFETDVTLCAGLPLVEVTSRILSQVPPAPDTLAADDTGAFRFPVEIKRGYWLSFAPAFEPDVVIRDFPLGVEPTKHQAFHALTFVDLVGRGAGLLLLHAGTQYFRRESVDLFSNLVMREWESYFTGEYGWPRYAEYRHAVLPHEGNLTNVDRLQTATGFSQKLITLVGRQKAQLAPKKSFLSFLSSNLHVLAFRKKSNGGFELRIAEVEGRKAEGSFEIDLPFERASETDLLGRKVGDVSRRGGKLKFEAKPWRIHTFELA